LIAWSTGSRSGYCECGHLTSFTFPLAVTARAC
jgi:transposase